MKVFNNKKITAVESKNVDIDVKIIENMSIESKPLKKNNIRKFILNIYDAEFVEFLKCSLIIVSILLLIILSVYGFMKQKGELSIISNLVTDDSKFSFKGWELTPALEEAIEVGDISLKDITVIERGGEVEFDGGDSDKITIVRYETIIEQNDSLELYSDEYWKELCKKGKNTYVLKTIGLSTEVEREGAK